MPFIKNSHAKLALVLCAFSGLTTALVAESTPACLALKGTYKGSCTNENGTFPDNYLNLNVLQGSDFPGSGTLPGSLGHTCPQVFLDQWSGTSIDNVYAGGSRYYQINVVKTISTQALLLNKWILSETSTESFRWANNESMLVIETKSTNHSPTPTVTVHTTTYALKGKALEVVSSTNGNSSKRTCLLERIK